jgi:hypothetical protein
MREFLYDLLFASGEKRERPLYCCFPKFQGTYFGVVLTPSIKRAVWLRKLFIIGLGYAMSYEL